MAIVPSAGAPARRPAPGFGPRRRRSGQSSAGAAPVVAAVLLVLSAASARGAPTVSAIAPAAGNTSGGTPVTVSGTGFQRGATLKVGNVACTQLKVVSSITIIGVTGAHAAGAASVTVFNTATDSSATNSLYTFNSTTDLTKTTKSDFEVAGSTQTNQTTTGLDSTLRWIDWRPASGGSMAAATYYYVVTATNAAGETQRSVQSAGTVLSGANNAVNLSWTPVNGALDYKLYRTITSGTYASPALIATLDTTGYKDVAVLPSAGAPPGTSSATGDLYLARGTTPGASFSAGPNLTGNAGGDAFAIQRPNGTFLIVHGNSLSTTTVYDPAAGTMSAGPALTGNAQEGAHAVKRPNGTFLIVHGNATTGNSIYDPVANTMSAGPALTANADRGAHAIKRPDGKFLILHGLDTNTSSLYDPVANTMGAGPTATGVVGSGGHSVPRPDGKFLIVHGHNLTTTSLYDPVANTMSAGPAVTNAVDKGGHSIQRPDGRYLIVCGSSSNRTCLYDPAANTMAAGPTTTNNVESGGHSIQRADGTFLIVEGKNFKLTEIYDPVANTTSAGPSTLNNVRAGGFSLQRPDGEYLLIDGTNTNKTEVYDAGWYRSGSYVSEKLHPANINFWNLFSWVRDSDDTLTTKIRTATSSAGLDVASWRTVANGGSINPGAGETWLEIGADDARAIPRSTLAQEDVWGKWRAEFRAWPRPLVLSFTASYTPTGLSVSPSKTTFAYGGRPLDVWVPADSSVITNDGTASENLLAKISTFTAGASTWSLSTTANGANQIRAQWSTSTAAGPWNDLSAYDQNFTIGTSVAVGGTVKLYFRIQTPTSSPANIQYASTLTVTGQ